MSHSRIEHRGAIGNELRIRKPLDSPRLQQVLLERLDGQAVLDHTAPSRSMTPTTRQPSSSLRNFAA